MINLTTLRLSSTAILTLLGIAVALSPARAQSSPDPTEVGKAVFKRGNCMGCHKWHGNGGGGYGGDALSLRKTELQRAEIIDTVGCGRPGTGMPFFLRGAYDTFKCHDMTRQDVGDHVPPEATVFLRPNEIEAVADYVLAHIKGRAEPDYAECISFFSDGSRVCNIYRTPGEATAGKAP